MHFLSAGGSDSHLNKSRLNILMRLRSLLNDVGLCRIGREGDGRYVVDATRRVVHGLLIRAVLHLDVRLHVGSCAS